MIYLGDWAPALVQVVELHVKPGRCTLFTSQAHQWVETGLPQTASSVQNAVIMDLSGKWPLLIDPEEQASRWIRRMYKSMKDSNLLALSMSDPK